MISGTGRLSGINRPVTSGNYRTPTASLYRTTSQKTFEIRFLGGNWYREGPELVLWDPQNELQVSIRCFTRSRAR